MIDYVKQCKVSNDNFRAFNKPNSSLAELIQNEIKHQSIWTIDLAYLFKKYEIPFVYYTVTIGAKAEYAYNVSRLCTHLEFSLNENLCFRTSTKKSLKTTKSV